MLKKKQRIVGDEAALQLKQENNRGEEFSNVKSNIGNYYTCKYIVAANRWWYIKEAEKEEDWYKSTKNISTWYVKSTII